jgi:TonB family protein
MSIVGAPFVSGTKLARRYAVFTIDVDEQGAVRAATLDESTGVEQIDDAAAHAVQTWKFVPANDECKAVESEVEYAVPVGAQPQTFADPCNHDALVAVQAQPVYPKVPDLWHVAEVQTTVSLDAAGRIVNHKVIQSSGYDALDDAATTAALQSSYFPAIHACHPTAGWYFFNVTFDPNA